VKKIAELIPAGERSVILEQNLIAKAIGRADQYEMNYLMVIWRTYVEPDLGVCPLCVNRILNNFRQLQGLLIEMEKQSKLLE
jgi:hypothetical protein